MNEDYICAATCYCGHVYLKAQDPSMVTKTFAFFLWIISWIISLFGYK